MLMATTTEIFMFLLWEDFKIEKSVIFITPSVKTILNENVKIQNIIVSLWNFPFGINLVLCLEICSVFYDDHNSDPWCLSSIEPYEGVIINYNLQLTDQYALFV